MLTIDRLRARLSYDSKTGNFTHSVGRCKGKVAGYKQSGGYTQILIDKVPYYAHRLAWMWVNGAFPEGMIDHIDGNRSNNSIDNLRCVSPSMNLENQRRARSNNGCGVLGVSATGARWRAAIKCKGKSYHIGTFDTPDAAKDAYLKAKRQMHEGCTI